MTKLPSASTQPKVQQENSNTKFENEFNGIVSKLTNEWNQDNPFDKLTLIRIKASILFCLNQMDIHDYQTNKKSLDECYEQGYQIVLYKIDTLIRLYKKLLTHRLPVINERYKMVFDVHLPNFIQLYDPRFNALDIHYDFDYPLVDDLAMNTILQKESGIDFVLEYTICLTREHSVSNLFIDEVETLICSYEQKFQVSTKLLTINFVELIIQNICIQNSTGSRYNSLTHPLDNNFKTRPNIQTVLSELPLPKNIVDYLSRHSEGIQVRLDIAYETETLFDMYIHTIEKRQIQYKMNDGIDLTRLRQLQEIWASTHDISVFSSKQNPTLNIYDIISILDENLQHIDYYEVFNLFDTYTLAFLLRFITPESFVFKSSVNLSAKSIREFTEHSYWEGKLLSFIAGLDIEKKNHILAICTNLNYEMIDITVTM